MPGRGAVNYDFLVGLALFAVAYVMVYTSLPSFSTGQRSLEDPLAADARYLAETLVTGPGTPKGWDDINTAGRLGFALNSYTVHQNVLDLNKLREIDGVACSELVALTDTTMSFKISAEVLRGAGSATYACAGGVPNSARLITRSAKTYYTEMHGPKERMHYNQSIVRLWVWMSGVE